MTNKSRIIRVGATVRNRETGELATVKYSTMGYKVGGFTEDGGHWKTLAMTEEEFNEYWEVIEE